MENKLKLEEVKKAISGTYGLFTNIGKNLGIDRCDVEKLVEKYPELEEVIEDERNSIMDLAMKKYIEYILNLKNVEFTEKIRNIYLAIRYCSGLEIKFPKVKFKKSDVTEYYQSDEWKEISSKIRERDNYCCKICGTGGKVEVHHIIPKSIGGTEDETNLITLCKDCHVHMPKKINTKTKINDLIIQNSTKNAIKPRQQRFIEEYIKSLGHISDSCKEIGIDRDTYYKWCKNNPMFENKLKETIENHNDSVERRILELALKEDRDMLKFWAKTKMKDRGFTEKSEQVVEHKGEQIKVIIEEKKPDGDKSSTITKTEPSV